MVLNLYQIWGELHSFHCQGRLQSLLGWKHLSKTQELCSEQESKETRHVLGNSQCPGKDWACFQPLGHLYTVTLPSHHVKNTCSRTTVGHYRVTVLRTNTGAGDGALALLISQGFGILFRLSESRPLSHF